MKYKYNYLASIFKRAVKLFDDYSNEYFEPWHKKLPKFEIAACLSGLSESSWIPSNTKTGFDFNYQLTIPFSSLEELKLKLTIRGY